MGDNYWPWRSHSGSGSYQTGGLDFRPGSWTLLSFVTITSSGLPAWFPHKVEKRKKNSAYLMEILWRLNRTILAKWDYDCIIMWLRAQALQPDHLQLHFLAVCPWAGLLTSLCFHLLIRERDNTCYRVPRGAGRIRWVNTHMSRCLEACPTLRNHYTSPSFYGTPLLCAWGFYYPVV